MLSFLPQSQDIDSRAPLQARERTNAQIQRQVGAMYINCIFYIN